MLINNLEDDVNGLEKEHTDFKKDLLQVQAKQSDGDNDVLVLKEKHLKLFNAVNETLTDIWQNLIEYDNQLRDRIARLPPGKFYYYNEQFKTCNYTSF